jgi:hypothetical protein
VKEKVREIQREKNGRIEVLIEGFDEHMKYYPKVKLMEIPTEPNPFEDEK